MSTTARRDMTGSNAIKLLSGHRASAIVLGSLILAASAFAHPTYNLAGNTGPGIGGSTPPGATNDGSPTDNATTWTNGLIDGYAGALPVNWYAGMHSRAVTRNIQSGLAPNPPKRKPARTGLQLQCCQRSRHSDGPCHCRRGTLLD